MIRMGRNKPENFSETTTPQNTFDANPNNFYNNEPENQYAQNRSTNASAGDAIAREIRDGSLSGYVGQGTVLAGEMNFQALLRVDGRLTGRIMSESGTLIVGASGQIEANVIVAAAIVNGLVRGDIVASEKIELGRTAQVIGNIQAPRLVMEDGAILEGNCVMLKAKEAFDKRSMQGSSRQAREAEAITMPENPVVENGGNDEARAS